jgi:hypothetical protein
VATQTIRLKREGAELFNRYAKAYKDAGFELDHDSIDHMADWLDVHGHVEAPVDVEQTRLLIRLVLSGGLLTVEVTP